MTIALIDYGAGNLRSAEKALLAAGAPSVSVTSDAAVVARASRILLPGVGAFGACIGALRALPGMVDALNSAVISDGRPFLGICVGMQLMAGAGEEFGTHAGLGWIGGTVRRMKPGPAYRIPHMGWNHVTPRAGSLVAPGDVYFTHSFAMQDVADADIAGTADHGGPIIAAVQRANMLGVQFHPEKSQAHGLDLLARFLAWKP